MGGLVCLSAMVGSAPLWAQEVPGQAAYPFSLLERPAILSLDTAYLEARQESISIPYINHDQQALKLRFDFQLPCTPPDTLMLYLEGVAWQMEVELNGRYLGIFEHPLVSRGILVRASWLREGTNILRLHLSKTSGFLYYPDPFLGLLEAPLLVDEAQYAVLNRNPLPERSAADTVAFFAPYYRSHGYVFDLETALGSLKPLLDRGHRQVFFLFPPGRKLQALCAQLGLEEVKEQAWEGRTTFFVNAYPFAEDRMPLSPAFWLDAKGYRTPHYASYTSEGRVARRPTKAPLMLAWMVLFPLIGLLLVKLLNASFFYGLPGILLKPKLYVDNFSDASYANLGLLILLQGVKFLCFSAAISLLLYDLSLGYFGDNLNVLRTPSLANQVFRNTESLRGFFAQVSLILVAWLGIKYFLNVLIGRIFNIKNMAIGVLNLDIVGSYPLIFLLGLPIALKVFAEGQAQTLFALLLVLLGGIYLIRKVYVFYIGLDKLFSFSFGMKILYICTFNVLPYIIWF